jgi:glycosidase
MVSLLYDLSISQVPKNVFRFIYIQEQDENVNSTLKYYKRLLALKNETAIKQSDNIHYAVVNDKVFSFVKEWDGIAR